MSVSSRTFIISANFQRSSKVLKIIFAAFEKSSSKCISSFQQDIKLDQFSQQNTHHITAFLQNSSLGALLCCINQMSFNIAMNVYSKLYAVELVSVNNFNTKKIKHTRLSKNS